MSLDSYIAKQFKNPTGIGGKLISFVMNKQNHHLYEDTIRLLELTNNDNILDIGCGNGTVLNMIAKQYNCMLTGIDTSMSIINTAIKHNQKFIHNKRMVLHCQNVNSMSFDNDLFNKVYTINTVYFWENLNNTMAEIYRILKPQGVFINTLYSNETLSKFSHTQFGYKQFNIEQLVRAGNETGFEVEVKPIQNGIAYCIFYYKQM